MISVTIATYDRPAYLRRALQSLLDGSQLPNEIVVVDQTEGEDTREVVDAFGSALLRYARHSPPSISGSRNRSVELAHGDYVAIVDDDCEFAPDWLEQVQRELARFSYPDALYGAIRHPDPDRDRKALHVSVFAPPAPRVWEFPAHPGLMGLGAHMILRRSTFLALGGFDERFGPGTRLLGAEDIDYNYRLLRRGYRAVSTPSIEVVHNQPRLQSQLPLYFFGKNHGQAAFCAKHLKEGDRYPWRILREQFGSDVRMLASGARRRSSVRARTGISRMGGTVVGLVRGWWTFRADRA
jgi:GT2 family glycosyltransferase